MTQETFDVLLTALHQDPGCAAEIYVTIHSKLVTFFEFRHCPLPEKLADEVVDRVSKKIVDGEVIVNLNGYFYGVARMLHKEIIKEQERKRTVINDLRYISPESEPELDDETEVRRQCFDRCLAGLPEQTGKILVDYYKGDKRDKIKCRKLIAENLNMSQNALRIEVYRLRAKLSKCVNECCEARQSK